MDWFHCNQCFTKRGRKFAVSSCGHICCEACIKSKQCSVCGTSCSYLAITDEMKPQEKVFFQDPVKLIQSRLEHISQIATFQRMQMERVITHFKHKSAELERHLKDVTEQSYRQLSELQKENVDLKKQLSHLKKEIAELKRPLAQRRVPPGRFQTEGHSSQRMALPVAITSPVTPRSRTMSSIGSAESQRWTRTRDPSLSFTMTYLHHLYSTCLTPGSATSLRETMTPTTFSTPIRTQTPNVFQFMSGLSIQSPRH